MVDFCTTSVLRPDILRSCYRSFQKNLVGINLKDCRVFLNIDPVPKVNWPHTPQDNIKVANGFFGEVVYRIAPIPCLGAAVKWMWSQVETDLVFLLEDDWMLLYEVDIGKLKDIFVKKRRIQQVRLTWSPMSYQLKKSSDGNGNIVPNYGLSPGITRKTYCRKYAALMPDQKFNPERFIRASAGIGQKMFRKPSLRKRKREVKYYKYDDDKYPNGLVKDLSKGWKISHGLRIKVCGQSGEWISRVKDKGPWTKTPSMR